VSVRRSFLSIFFLFLITGCGDQEPTPIFDDYEGRLYRTLDIRIEDQYDTSALSGFVKPRPEQWQIRLESLDLGPLDFLALTGCELQIIVGKRNSSLGKLAKPSQQLVLDIEFLQHAPACLSHLRQLQADADLIAKVEAAQTLKKSQLESRIFNAILAGPEWHAFWRRRDIPPGYPQAQTSEALISTLDQLSQQVSLWLNGQYEVNSIYFENLLNELRAGDGGILLRAADLTEAYFVEWVQGIEQSPYFAKPCTRLTRDRRDILQNVSARFFAQGVQQWLAPVASRALKLTEATNRLEALMLKAQPAAYREWHRQRNERLGALRQRPKQHVAYLTRILEPCS